MTIEERDKLAILFDTYKGLLTQNQRQVMHLYLIEDLSISEIAKIMATSRQATNDAIKKGKNKIKKIAITINQ